MCPLGVLDLVAQATSLSELGPYLALLAFGFLVGAWGQAARAPLAVAIGMSLIAAAVVLFLLANDSGDLPRKIDRLDTGGALTGPSA